MCHVVLALMHFFFPPNNWHPSGFHCVHSAAEESEILFLVFHLNINSCLPVEFRSYFAVQIPVSRLADSSACLGINKSSSVSPNKLGIMMIF